MFCFSLRCFDRLPFSTLFSYNCVLQSVFSAPTNKEAIVVELPGKTPQSYTYGQLQKDVLSISNLITQRREAVTMAQGKPSLSWVQPPRPTHVRSVFVNGDEGEFSCDVMKDDGIYNMAIIGHTGYSFVVSLLAAWSLNQMAVPMSLVQKQATDASYILQHSKSRAVMGDTELLKNIFLKDYNALLVHSFDCLRNPIAVSLSSLSSSLPNFYKVETLFDVPKLLQKIHDQPELSNVGTKSTFPEHLFQEEEHVHMKSAQDIMDRLPNKEAAAEGCLEARRQYILREQFKTNCTVDDGSEGAELYYDTENLDSLNTVHRLWVKDPATRPSKNDDCVIIYTSGTTANPKGAVHTHASVQNMVKVLQSAWEWSSEDCILHMLPIYHIHGLVNILLCSLASNARCVLTKFDDSLRIAHRLEKGDISLVMGVPTIYTKLIAAVKQKMSPIEKKGFKNAVSQKIRLMVSGSAALPVPILHEFREISGHTLLERYGMTEIGMALSQPLHPVDKRIPGTVGVPLPTVRAFVHHGFSSSNKKEKEEEETRQEFNTTYDEVGQLAIASQSLFDRYWNDPTATRKDLVLSSQEYRYFNTGDIVGVWKPNDKHDEAIFSILGRSSVDIIKCCGYKLSALEIEAALLSRKDLFFDIVVLGCKDDTKGEKVVAVIEPQPAALQKWNIPVNFDRFESAELNEELNEVARGVLAHYKCPERFIILPKIPRNSTGKINKKSILENLSLN